MASVAAAAVASEFKKGDRVVIGGLGKATHYNGKEGIVSEIVEGRVCVKIDDGKKTLRVLEKNLRPLWAKKTGYVAVKVTDPRDIDFITRFGMSPHEAHTTWQIGGKWPLDHFLSLCYKGVGRFMSGNHTGKYVPLESVAGIAFQLTLGTVGPCGIYSFERGRYGESKQQDIPDYTQFICDLSGPAAMARVLHEGKMGSLNFSGTPSEDFETFLRRNEGTDKFTREEMYRIFLVIYLGNHCSMAIETMVVALTMLQAKGIGIVYDGQLIEAFELRRATMNVLPHDLQRGVVRMDFEDGYVETVPRDSPHQELNPASRQLNALKPLLTGPFGHEVIELTSGERKLVIDMTPQFVDPSETVLLKQVNGTGECQWPFRFVWGPVETYSYSAADATIETMYPPCNTARTVALLSYNTVASLGESLQLGVVPASLARRMAQRSRRPSDNRSRRSQTHAAPARKKKIKVNAPCPCGSGKKYKKCCMNK